MIGARLLLLGAISGGDDGSVRVHLRLTDMETGVIGWRDELRIVL